MLEALGRYKLIRQVAVGGMGEVFLARQTGVEGFDRQCVVKVMHAGMASNPDSVELFLDEARLTARLTHSHIAQVYDFGKIDGVFFLAMEWVDGPPLNAVLKHYSHEGRFLPMEVAARLVAQAAQGLDYVHRLKGPDGALLQLVHRDVSPSNLLLSKEGMVKIIDFGIAKARISASRSTRLGEVRGKLAYMSPEQLTGEKLDGRTDMFSLGLVLYELLTCRRAVKGKNEVDLLVAARSRAWTPVEEVRPNCPPGLRAVLTRALEPRREDRYASMGDFAEALEAVIAAERWVVSPGTLARLAEEVGGSGVAAAPGSATPSNPLSDELATEALSEAVRASMRGAIETKASEPASAQPPAPPPEAHELTAATRDELLPPPAPRKSGSLKLLLAGALACGVAGTGVAVLWPRPDPKVTPTPVVEPRIAPTIEKVAKVAKVEPAPAPLPSPEPPEPSPAPVPVPVAAPTPPTARPAGTGLLDVMTDPAMELVVDGKPQGTTPKTLTLTAGAHRVLLRSPSLRISKEQRVSIAARGTQRIEWRPKQGQVEVRAVPPHVEMTVRVDGADMGSTPLSAFSIWEGDHTVTVSNASGWSATKKVRVPPGATVTVRANDGASLDVTVK